MKYIFILLLALVSATTQAKTLEPREVPPEIYMDRAGLPELVLQSTATGFVVGPLLTFAIFDDNLRQSSGFLLGPTLGVALPFLLNKDKPVHVAQASTYNFFQRSGLFNGLLLTPLILESNLNSDPSDLGNTAALVVSGFTLTSTWLGTVLEPKLQLTPGQASALSSSYFIGAGTGIALYAAFAEGAGGPRSVALTTLFTANGLSLATYFTRDTFDIDRSRVIMMDIGAVVGGLAGAGLGFFIFGEDVGDKALILSSVAGVYGGLYLAYTLTGSFDNYKRSANQPTAGVITLESPSPMVLTSVDSERGTSSLGFGLNILNGTW